MTKAITTPDTIFAFASKETLMEVLRSLPDNMVCLVGYVDNDNVIYRLEKKDLCNDH